MMLPFNLIKKKQVTKIYKCIEDATFTYQYDNFSLGLPGIYQSHDGLYSTSYFLCCVFMVVCSNPNNNDL